MQKIVLSIDYDARESFHDSALNTSLIGLLHNVNTAWNTMLYSSDTVYDILRFPVISIGELLLFN